MPSAPKQKPTVTSTGLPCAAATAFSRIDLCLPTCMNCRRAVEESMTRVAGRKMRKLRRLPECSVSRCVSFLRSIPDEKMRFHMAAMAWWRMSSDDSGINAEPIRAIMSECRTDEIPDIGIPYLHTALKTLSVLSQEQLTSWFGHGNLYNIAELFSGGVEPVDGVHCAKCRLYRMGCTAHNMLGANDCPLWNDAFVQGVASAVSKAGTWKNPCKGIVDTLDAKGVKK